MNTPQHYDFEIEPVEFILKNNIPFCEGNVIKYVCRWTRKNGLEDIKKARHYLDILIDHVMMEESKEHYDEIIGPHKIQNNTITN